MEKMYHEFEFFNCLFSGGGLEGVADGRPYSKSYCDRIFWQKRLFLNGFSGPYGLG